MFQMKLEISQRLFFIIVYGDLWNPIVSLMLLRHCGGNLCCHFNLWIPRCFPFLQNVNSILALQKSSVFIHSYASVSLQTATHYYVAIIRSWYGIANTACIFSLGHLTVAAQSLLALAADLGRKRKQIFSRAGSPISPSLYLQYSLHLSLPLSVFNCLLNHVVHLFLSMLII